MYLFLGIGFCGALTTFSGWIFDSFQLIFAGSPWQGLGMIFSNLFFGIFAAFIGLICGAKVRKLRLFRLHFLIHRFQARRRF